MRSIIQSSQQLLVHVILISVNGLNASTAARSVHRQHSETKALNVLNTLMRTRNSVQKKRTLAELVCSSGNERQPCASSAEASKCQTKKSRKPVKTKVMSYATTGGQSSSSNERSQSQNRYSWRRQHAGRNSIGDSMPLRMVNPPDPLFHNWRQQIRYDTMHSWPPQRLFQPPLPTEPYPEIPSPPPPPPPPSLKSTSSTDQSPRNWVTTPFGEHYSKDNAVPFTLMSYNILAQDLLNVHRDLYFKNDPDHLVWEHRLKCLTAEISGVGPDILCLQEVQETHLTEIDNCMKPLKLNTHLYKKRNGSQVDGCAIFYNGDKFEIVDHQFVEYFQPNVESLNRYNVAIIAKFALKTNPRMQFIVATTHLLYNPRRHDIRLAQTQVLLAELDRMSYRELKQPGCPRRDPLPIIITGDFNLEFSSEAYKLVTEGFVRLDRLSLPQRGRLLPIHLGITDNCQHFNVVTSNQRKETMLFNSERQKPDGKGNLPSLNFRKMKESGLPFQTGGLTHNLNLSTALQICDAYNRPVASTYHRQWIMVDYIFYTKYRRRTNSRAPPMFSPLQLLSYLELPSVGDCYAMGPIPNAQIGSDHYSLATRFVLYPDE